MFSLAATTRTVAVTVLPASLPVIMTVPGCFADTVVLGLFSELVTDDVPVTVATLVFEDFHVMVFSDA